VYSQDVVFKEVRGTSKVEEAKREKEPNKLVVELRNEEFDLDDLTESDEEVKSPSLVLRRYK